MTSVSIIVLKFILTFISYKCLYSTRLRREGSLFMSVYRDIYLMSVLCRFMTGIGIYTYRY